MPALDSSQLEAPWFPAAHAGHVPSGSPAAIWDSRASPVVALGRLWSPGLTLSLGITIFLSPERPQRLPAKGSKVMYIFDVVASKVIALLLSETDDKPSNRLS